MDCFWEISMQVVSRVDFDFSSLDSFRMRRLSVSIVLLAS